MCGDRQAEHAIAEKFEALIGLDAPARLRLGREMGQRERGQFGIAESVAEPRLEIRDSTFTRLFMERTDRSLPHSRRRRV